MNPTQAIANYEYLSALTGQMREAAEQGEWDQLIGLEPQCSDLLATMQQVDAEAELDEATRQYKIELINKILADDTEVRKHTQIWMSELQRAMQSNRQEQRLQHAYGE